VLGDEVAAKIRPGNKDEREWKRDESELDARRAGLSQR
jgi:hypothetical protein